MSIETPPLTSTSSSFHTTESSFSTSSVSRARLPKCPSCGHELTHDDLLVVHGDLERKLPGVDLEFARHFLRMSSSDSEDETEAEEREGEATVGRRRSRKGKEREAVGTVQRLVSLVEKLSDQLSSSLALQEDIQAELKIAQSNLVLAEANAEALEEALRRRRESSSTSRHEHYPGSAGSHRRTNSNTSGWSSTLSTPMFNNGFHSPKIEEEDLAVERVEETKPEQQTGSRFWRLGGKKKNSSNGSTPNQTPPLPSTTTIFFPGIPTPPSGKGARLDSYMPLTPTSSGSEHSMPQMHLNGMRTYSDLTPLSGESARIVQLTNNLEQLSLRIQELEASNSTLNSDNVTLSISNEKVRKENEELVKNHQALQEEVENLSAVLFEEANNMVAKERQERAEEKEGLQTRIDELEREILLLKDRLIGMEREREKESEINTPRIAPIFEKERTPSIASSASSVETKDVSAPTRPKRTRWFSFGRSASAENQEKSLPAVPPLPPMPPVSSLDVQPNMRSPRERTISAPISPSATQLRTPIARMPSASTFSTVPPSPILSHNERGSSEDSSITPISGTSSLPDDVKSDLLSPDASLKRKHKPSPLSWIGTQKDDSLPSLAIPSPRRRAQSNNERPVSMLSVSSAHSLPLTPKSKPSKKRSMVFFDAPRSASALDVSSSSKKKGRAVPSRSHTDYNLLNPDRTAVPHLPPTLMLDFERTQMDAVPFPSSSKSDSFILDGRNFVKGEPDDLMQGIISLGKERGFSEMFEGEKEKSTS
ncbi:hypothetical protein BT69DRAFT_1337191 [Atractiella rhizophila]|nr:hypothetical protein BT69DRAFT_1337191 [Atractiella rhizophila]